MDPTRPIKVRTLLRRPISLAVLLVLFGLLLWGRLRLRDDVPKMVVADPETRGSVESMTPSAPPVR